MAIVETLTAMSVSIWFAIRFQTYVHLAIGALITPALIMQTDESTRLGEWIIRSLTNWVWRAVRALTRHDGLLGPLNVIVLVCLLAIIPVILVVAQLAAWALVLVRKPGTTIAAIPDNWRHSTLVLDSAAFPSSSAASTTGIESVGGEMVQAGPTNYVERIWTGFFARQMNPAVRLVIGLISLLLTALLVFPPILYRWALKSTAVIWFPLLWALRAATTTGTSPVFYFSRYLRDPLTWIVVATSLLSLVMLGLKLILWSEWAGFVEWWDSTALLRVLSLYVAPAELPWWQLVMAINSLSTIFMAILAVHLQADRERANPETELLPRRIFQAALFIRPILSAYTIACTLYITIVAASKWNLPPLGENLFPWP